MKNLRKLIYVSCILFIGCTGVQTPNLSGNEFIIGKMEVYQDTLCIYTSKLNTFKFSEMFSNRQRFIADKGLYNIGDTVCLIKKPNEHGF